MPNPMTSRTLAALAGLLVLLVGPLAARADDGVDAVLTRLTVAYKDVPSIEASFVQTSSGMSYIEPLVQKGTLAIERPGKMRWDFVSPTKQQYISDGKTLWVVSEADRTCTIYRQVGGALATYFDFLTGMADVRTHFDVRVGAAVEGKDVLVLEPLQPDSTLGTMTVQVDKATGLVSGVLSVTPFGDQTDVQLGDVKTGRDLPDADFVWTSTEGYKEVEGG